VWCFLGAAAAAAMLAHPGANRARLPDAAAALAAALAAAAAADDVERLVRRPIAARAALTRTPWTMLGRAVWPLGHVVCAMARPLPELAPAHFAAVTRGTVAAAAAVGAAVVDGAAPPPATVPLQRLLLCACNSLLAEHGARAQCDRVDAVLADAARRIEDGLAE